MRRVGLFTVLMLLVLSPGLRGQVPQVMSYQGVLTDSNGQPVAAGNYILTFRIYNTNAGGSELWAEAHQVAMFDGMFSIVLGSQVALNLPFDESYWVGVSIDGGSELLPRRRLTTAAYSFATRTVAPNSITAAHIVGGAVTPDKLSTTGATAGQALVFNGTNVAWDNVQSQPGGTGFVLPINESVADPLSAFEIANTGSGDAVAGIATKGFGLYGESKSAGSFAAGTVGFVPSPHPDSISMGVFGENDGVGLASFGVAGLGVGAGVGVFGESDELDGVGVWGFSANGFAGLFSGDVGVTGDAEVLGFLFKTGGGFKIDHPLDPETKYLYHSFVESPDMTNLYNGTVTLDASGTAWVALPAWFDALNGDVRYQLTAIGAPMPNLHIAAKVSGNRFGVAGGVPGAEVSWQVTGIRRDPYAREHRIVSEVNKPVGERGRYLHPELYGQSPEMGIRRLRNARRPEDRKAYLRDRASLHR